MPALLRRQLRKLGLSEDSPPSAAEWHAFLERVGRTYTDAEQDRYTLERSMMMSSRETQELYDELRRSETNFKVLVEHLPDPVFVHRGGAIVYANPALAELLGFETSDDLIGKSAPTAFVHAEDRERLVGFGKQHDAGDRVASIQLRWVRKDGGVVHVHAFRTAITFDNRAAVLVIGRDITERLRAEAARREAADQLRVSEERYRTLFEGSPLPILLFDPGSLRILVANEAATRVYGYAADEFLTLRLSDLKLPEADAELTRGMAAHVRAGLQPPDGAQAPWRGAKRHVKKDGTVIEIDLTAHPVMLDGSRAILAIGKDVTETRRLEAQLRQAQKMEAVGQLAGGIAHDFNNILGVILMDSEQTLSELDEGHPVREYVREIAAAGQRAASLTRQLLTFSRLQPCQPRALELNPVVTNLEKMIRRIIGENIEISTSLARGLDLIEADPGQIEQVLMNLVVNARDAMPHGGKLTIETSNVDVSAARALEEGVPVGRHVVLAVTDTGTGMDAAIRARIFDPFFTTKEVGKGTGLGLATVYGIVQQAGGGISVRSEPGCGATFRAYFPRVAAGAAAVTEARKASVLPPARETILVVEDEEDMRRVVCRLLSSRGYEAIDAPNAQAALEILEDRRGGVHLIVTDLVMPGLDGRSLAALATTKEPGALVLFMSGYTEHASVKRGTLGPMDHFIQKPFTAEEMIRAVRRVLDGRGRASNRHLHVVKTGVT